MITAIVCVDQNNGIGNNNDLLINIPEDMKYFKRITTSGEVNSLIVGRKTYESLPQKMLDTLSKTNRHCVVVTKKVISPTFHEDSTVRIDMDSLKYWLKSMADNEENLLYNHEFFIIGGGQIYNELLPYCDVVHMTKVYHAFENVDTYFPVDKMDRFELVSTSDINEYNGVKYQFKLYVSNKGFVEYD